MDPEVDHHYDGKDIHGVVTSEREHVHKTSMYCVSQKKPAHPPADIPSTYFCGIAVVPF